MTKIKSYSKRNIGLIEKSEQAFIVQSIGKFGRWPSPEKAGGFSQVQSSIIAIEFAGNLNRASDALASCERRLNQLEVINATPPADIEKRKPAN